jgi:nucleoside 2-deoxyribosyltransferase
LGDEDRPLCRGASAILGSMKLYFAAPLFSAAERSWNEELAAAVRAAGHEVFLPQEQEPGKDAPGIFGSDVAGIDWADALVAIVDGPDPDSGTAWECGYAYGKKPIILVRTDIRAQTGSGGAPYNAMLSESATIRLDLPSATMARVRAEVLDALGRLEESSASRRTGT